MAVFFHLGIIAERVFPVVALFSIKLELRHLHNTYFAAEIRNINVVIVICSYLWRLMSVMRVVKLFLMLS